MKSNILKLMVFGLILGSAYSCKTLNIEKPKESYLPTQLTPVISELPMKIEIDIKKLEMAVNKQMTGLLFEGEKLNNQDLSVKVWKAKDFSFMVKNNVIEYKVPLKIWSRFAWNVEKFGIKVGDKYEANGSIMLGYTTHFEIDKNWKLVAKTTSTGFQWIETPKVNILGITVPVTPIATYALQKSQQLINKEIDNAISGMAEIKKYAQMAWTEMQKPYLVSEGNNLWLRITPKSINLSPFESKGQKLAVTLSLQASIESFMGIKPEALKPVALPPFTVSTKQPKEFNLNIAADATFEKITEIAKSQLINRKFEDGKRYITVTDLSAFGSEGKVVFVVDVTGSLKGRIFLTGNMAYNPEKISVEVLNPEFDIRTKNALVSSANWLLNGVIVKKMAPYLSYSVKEELESMKAEANKSLKNFQVYEGVSLTGLLNTVTVQSLDLVPGAVRLNANVKGNISMKVDELSW